MVHWLTRTKKDAAACRIHRSGDALIGRGAAGSNHERIGSGPKFNEFSLREDASYGEKLPPSTILRSEQ